MTTEWKVGLQVKSELQHRDTMKALEYVEFDCMKIILWLVLSYCMCYVVCSSLLSLSTTGTEVQGMWPISVITIVMRSGDVTS